MQIVLRDMPAEQVFRVDYENHLVPGWVKRDEDGKWYAYHSGKRGRKAYRSKEAAALMLVIIYFEEEHGRIRSVA